MAARMRRSASLSATVTEVHRTELDLGLDAGMGREQTSRAMSASFPAKALSSF
jgi:hypothetical protein